MTGILVVFFVAVFVAALVRTFRIVPQASVFVIERLGKYSRTLDPGLHILVPVLDKVRARVDIREQVVSFPPQAVITKDNLVVGIDSVIYYSVTDPSAATYRIESFVAAIEQLVVTTLRNVVGGMQLEEALTGRDHINERLAAVLDEATGKWGVKVNRVEIRGIEPPPTIRDAMEQAMRADRGKRAAILTAEGARQSAVLNAEGSKEAVVLNAQAQREAVILTAQAQRESAIMRAEGEAQAIAIVVEAIRAAGVDETVLAFQRQQLLPKIAEGAANKVWFVPTDMGGMLNSLGEAARAVGAPPQQQPARPAPRATQEARPMAPIPPKPIQARPREDDEL